MEPAPEPFQVIHLVEPMAGHTLSTDCWCEPSNIRWIRNKSGILLLVIEHMDDRVKPHFLVTAERERDIKTPFDPDHIMGIDESWITRAIEAGNYDEPKQLPPHDPHERNL